MAAKMKKKPSGGTVDDKARITRIIELLKKEFPDAKIDLHYTNPLELLIATILSAQCTDERVNIVTKTLFEKYRKAKDYADAGLKELEQDIKSTGSTTTKPGTSRNAAKCLLKNSILMSPEQWQRCLNCRELQEKLPT